MRCQDAAGAPQPNGEICSGSGECVSGICDDGPRGRKRCVAGIMTIANASMCAAPLECMSGTCLQSAARLSCTTCVAGGGICSADDDCCGTASCIADITGRLTCSQ